MIEGWVAPIEPAAQLQHDLRLVPAHRFILGARSLVSESMKVALVKSPRESGGLFSENSESLALAYLAASLRAAGFEVVILNAALRGWSEADLVNRILTGDFGLVGFNLPDPSLVASTFSVAGQLRAAGFGGHICAGGHTATFHADHVLSNCSAFDSVALREGEETIVELAQAIASGTSWATLQGIVARTAFGRVRNAERAQTPDLDELPLPARDDLAWVLENVLEAGTVPVLASRGCYFNCSFCSVRAFYEADGRATWRRRRISDVLLEIEQLIDKYGVTDILFVDDLFVSRSKATLQYAETFARAILDKGLQFTFTLSATVDSVGVETFELLRDAGMRQVFLGAESASTDVLRALRKWFKPDDIANAVKILDSLGIESSVSYINFTPATRMSHLRENLAFFSSLESNILQGLLNRYQVYGGTPLFEDLKAAGRLTGDFPDYQYVGTDPDVELAYNICQRALGSFIPLQYELKKVERRARTLFHGDDKSLRAVPSEAQRMLKSVRRGINAEVGEVFTRILDFVDEQVTSSSDVNRFTQQISGEARVLCDGWVKTLHILQHTLSSIRHTTPYSTTNERLAHDSV